MHGILKSKPLLVTSSSTHTTAKKNSSLSENDIYFSFQLARANARRNATIISNTKNAAPMSGFKNQGQKIEADQSRNVRFFDEPPLSPKSVSILKASRKKSYSLSLSGVASESPQAATAASKVPPVICESLLNPTDQDSMQNSDRRAWISAQFDQRLPNFVESIMSGWKDALASNDIFQSLTPAWLNGSKPL